MDVAIREPAVAGRFYPGEPERLAETVSGCLAQRASHPEPVRMVMAPHAGYVYSGAIAGATYARVDVPSRVVVLCPNHTGLGARRSLWPNGSWNLPGFSLAIDRPLADAFRDHAKLADDRLAHVREHAIEVQLPFLHALRADVSIVPVCLAGLRLRDCNEVGEGLARAIQDAEREGSERVLIVASTDMSHYIPAEVAKELDRMAIECVLGLDAPGLYAVVTQHDISMCGYIPTTVALFAARALGAQRSELVRYGNSGDVSGDYNEVVGYAGALVG
jgi:AmmeMemoRadiSam system protein B